MPKCNNGYVQKAHLQWWTWGMPGCQDGGKSKHVISMLVANPHQCQAVDLQTWWWCLPCLLASKTHKYDSMSIANTHDRHMTTQLLAHLRQGSHVSRHTSIVSTEQNVIRLCHLCQHKSHHVMLAKLAVLLLSLPSHPAISHNILLQHKQGETVFTEIANKCRLRSQGYKMKEFSVQYLIKCSFVTVHTH